LRDDQAADDVAQESLLAGMRRPPRGRNVRGWLGAVARNKALMALRSESRRRRREERMARPEALPSTADAVARLELQRRIVEVVLALDEPYRSVIVQRFFYDLPPSKIAERLGVPRETIRTRLRRALEHLRQRLDGEYGGDRNAWSLILIPMVLPAAGSSAAAGVVVMTTKTKVSILAVLGLMLTLFTGWQMLREERGVRRVHRDTATDAPPSVPGEAATPQLPAPVDFARIDRDRDLHGRVVSADGEPVAGARLRAVLRPWERANTLADFPPDPGPDTISAADGSFRLPLRRGALVDLRAQASGYAEITLARLQAGECVRVVLAPAARTVVRVVDSRGQPVASALVVLARYADGGGPRIEQKKATGRDGRAAFDGLPVGVALHASATHADHGTSLGARKLVAGDEIEFALNEGRVIQGRIVDAETQAPVADARVGMNWPLTPETRTDGAGRYRLNGWIAGRNVYHAIHVLASGYPRAVVRVTNETTIDFALEHGDFVTGRAVDEQGRPIAGARVAVIGDDDWVLSMAHGRTDSAGTFRLGPLSRKMPHGVIVMAEGHGRTLAGIRPRAEKPGTIELGDVSLPRGRSIEGRVVDARGQPVARVQVELRGGHRAHDLPPPPADLHHGDEERRLTDDLGRFRFPDLGPGAYLLRLQRSGGAAVELDVDFGDTDRRDIVLTVPGGRMFTVLVEEDDGRPVSNADVVATHEGGQSYQRTGNDGLAELTVSGSIKAVQVISVAQGAKGSTPPFRRYPKLLDLPADSSEVRLVLERWAPITGVVVDGLGKGVGHARVVALWTGGSRYTYTSVQGEFRAIVPPGTEAALIVSGRTNSDFMLDPDLSSEPVRAAAGARGVRLIAGSAARTQSLRVKVVGPDDRPIQNARVLGKGEEAETDKAGIARLTSLPGYGIRIEVDAAGFAPPVPVDVVPHGQEITLRCRVGVVLRGSVITSGTTPAAGARVLVVAGEEEFETVTDDAGRFELMVPAGAERVGLVAVAGGDRADLRQHRLDGGEAVLRLQPTGD
jgi:RNA polymerase sigma-70 factor (ECF subfamily)